MVKRTDGVRLRSVVPLRPLLLRHPPLQLLMLTLLLLVSLLSLLSLLRWMIRPVLMASQLMMMELLMMMASQLAHAQHCQLERHERERLTAVVPRHPLAQWYPLVEGAYPYPPRLPYQRRPCFPVLHSQQCFYCPAMHEHCVQGVLAAR